MKSFWIGFIALIFLFTSCGNGQKEASDTLRISTEEDASTLDPRLARDLPNVTTLHMLFEGLMRKNHKGEVVLGVAEKVDVSPDQKKYTFHLRHAMWSNGEFVSAHDFADTWKSMLEPSFPAPNAYQLYVIKGAKAAKEGKASIDQVGIRTIDAQTLVVELEAPTPYFLDLATSFFYFPVHHTLRKNANLTDKNVPSKWISNGPYKLEAWARHNELIAVKNPYYWDQRSVNIYKISILNLDENTALQMLASGELDWTGSPMCTIPADAIKTLRQEGNLYSISGAGTHLFRLNTQKPPFNNVKMRRAFGLAIDRGALVEHVLQGDQKPATGLVPVSFDLQKTPYFNDHDIPLAQKLFDDALLEMKLTKTQLPSITLSYSNGERNHKIAQAIQQQWNKAFGIDVKLEGAEGKFIIDKIRRQDFQIASGSWFADFADPINFLDLFKYRANSTNQTQWENATYMALLDKSTLTVDKDERWELLTQAEKLLMDEMPVIPLFYSTFVYAKNPRVKSVYFSDLGYLDFKHATLE